MTKIPKLKILFLLSTFYFLLSPAPTLAAKLNLTSQTQEIAVGQQFQVDLMLDTEGEIINAIEGEITFPQGLLEIKEIRDGDSIINLWVEGPSIKPTGRVIFSGIIPTGFAGVLSPYYEGYRPGKIFSLIFISKSEGNGTVNLENGKVLLHDGLGTPTQLSISPLQVKISREISLAPAPGAIEDTGPPEDFKPEIAQSPEIFDGKWFLVFATQDKGSGIAYYAVHESTRIKSLINTKEWTIAESPYVLKDQKLRSFIYVKAVDKAGNERITTLPPRYPLAWYENYFIWVKIILGVILAIVIGYILWRIKRKKSFSG